MPPALSLSQHASETLVADKAVTHEDARRVTKAEAEGHRRAPRSPEHMNEEEGVAAQMQAAAKLNEPE